MALVDLSDWLDEFSKPDRIIFAKRLSANDTQQNGSHQAGPYIPKELLPDVMPAINRTDIKNPDTVVDFAIDSHPDRRQVRAVYYNNKFHENPKSGRNEARMTGFNGTASPLLDPESTGAIVVFSFKKIGAADRPDCHIWIARDPVEEDLIEDRFGTVYPGHHVLWAADKPTVDLFTVRERASCWLTPHEMPPAWVSAFPSGADIARKSVAMRPCRELAPDHRLLKRLNCEFEIFKSVEEAVEAPAITKGFADIEEFIKRAQTVLQRRKSRAGRSLELQAREIFLEERLVEGVNFSHQPESEAGKRPDFLFPSQEHYQNGAFPAARLRMLAAKTTCKDRWRQVINEADRIPIKHLLTLQQGVSENQFSEMHDAGVRLVVPSTLMEAYPVAVRPQLQTLERFIGDIRLL